jgi:hypothetical protein
VLLAIGGGERSKRHFGWSGPSARREIRVRFHRSAFNCVDSRRAYRFASNRGDSPPLSRTGIGARIGMDGGGHLYSRM